MTATRIIRRLRLPQDNEGNVYINLRPEAEQKEYVEPCCSWSNRFECLKGLTYSLMGMGVAVLTYTLTLVILNNASGDGHEAIFTGDGTVNDKVVTWGLSIAASLIGLGLIGSCYLTYTSENQNENRVVDAVKILQRRNGELQDSLRIEQATTQRLRASLQQTGDELIWSDKDLREARARAAAAEQKLVEAKQEGVDAAPASVAVPAVRAGYGPGLRAVGAAPLPSAPDLLGLPHALDPEAVRRNAEFF